MNSGLSDAGARYERRGAAGFILLDRPKALNALTLPMVAIGARGVISVTSNAFPAEVSRATRLALEGTWDEARRAHLALLPVHEAMFLEASPAPVKAVLAMRGVMKDAVRGPIARCTEPTRKALGAVLDAYARSQR